MSRFRTMSWADDIRGGTASQNIFPSLARKLDEALYGACRGEARVTRISAEAFSVPALLFWLNKVQVDVVAVPLASPPAYCLPPPAFSPPPPPSSPPPPPPGAR